ncbi:hypothetical protein A3J21_03370 [Candidatus Daviesbacteria bacterium RIFCSPLOWO2_02_FULL_43_11]|nr:MAG: hypothetical protein A3J21_03370 [Candidatus Daviesbacteria bacterium RIFCSPLOWO2_02_FULL_43_11]
MSIGGAEFTSIGQGEIRAKLLEQQRWVSDRLQEMQRSDPVLAESEPEPEIGTEAWKDTTHAEMEVKKQGLLRLQKDAQEVINLLEKGLYGKCKTCGKHVEEVRLKFPVTATKCASCAASSSTNIQYQRAA